MSTFPDFKILPYFVDENLQKRKTQPKWVKKTDFYKRDPLEPTTYVAGDKKEDGFRRVCRGELKGTFDGNYTQPSVPKCHYVHHHDPYLSEFDFWWLFESNFNLFLDAIDK